MVTVRTVKCELQIKKKKKRNKNSVPERNIGSLRKNKQTEVVGAKVRESSTTYAWSRSMWVLRTASDGNMLLHRGHRTALLPDDVALVALCTLPVSPIGKR